MDLFFGKKKSELHVRAISSKKQAFAGFIAGGTSSLLTYPLDLIKTRFQSTHYAHYSSATKAIKSIIKLNGMRGLLSGIETSFIASSLAWGSYFYLYSSLKKWLRYNVDQKLTPAQHLTSSFIAGALTQIATNPMWVIKTNAQLNISGSFVSNMHSIYGQRGMIGFYRGLTPAFFAVFQSSVHFMVYEELKYNVQSKENKFMSPMQTILVTIIAKTTAVLLTYPYQLLRTRLQHIGGESQKIFDILQNVYRLQGLKGFYRGIHINLVRIMPSTCITFLVYETVQINL